MQLGEQIQRDRERLTWTQDELVARLNAVPADKRPLDPYTRNPKAAQRSWVSKVEAGLLRRDLAQEVRMWFAKVLDGDVELYLKLPLLKESRKAETDPLDEQKKFLCATLEKIGPKSHIQIDAPQTGPLSNHRSHLLALLAGIITQYDSNLTIFSNEPYNYRSFPPITMQCMMFLYTIVGFLAGGCDDEVKLRARFRDLDWEEGICDNTSNIFSQTKYGRELYGEVYFSKAVLDWIDQHLTVHVLKEQPNTTDRYNPLTTVLAESGTASKQAVFILDGCHLPWELTDNVSSAARRFDERRVLFKRFRPTFKEICEYASLFGITLKETK